MQSAKNNTQFYIFDCIWVKCRKVNDVKSSKDTPGAIMNNGLYGGNIRLYFNLW